MSHKKIVAVVDDDESVRESLPALLESFGFQTRAFSSAEQYLDDDKTAPDCLILDVAMPGMSGPELYRELVARSRRVPTIFITAHSSDGIGPISIDRNVTPCLVKPFSEEGIVSAVRAALEQSGRPDD